LDWPPPQPPPQPPPLLLLLWGAQLYGLNWLLPAGWLAL
jgi:hypothetical protein